MPTATRPRRLRKARQPRQGGRATAIGVDIVMGEREGARFRDAYSGRWFWNCHCNGGVFNLGPPQPGGRRGGADGARPPRRRQPPPDLRLARAARREPRSDAPADRLPFAVFTPSGSEAVDLALTLARAHTGRRGDRRGDSAPTTGSAGFALGGQRPALVRAVRRPAPPGSPMSPFNDREALGADRSGGAAAAVILESIPATLGFPRPLRATCAAVGELAHEHGALLDPRRGPDRPRADRDAAGTTSRRTSSPTCHHGQGARRGHLSDQRCAHQRGAGATSSRPIRSPTSRRSAAPSSAASSAAAVVDGDRRPGLPRARPSARRAVRGGLRRAAVRPSAPRNDDGARVRRAGGRHAAAKRLIDAGVFAVFAEHDHSVTQFKPPLILTDDEVDQIIGTVRDALR